MNWQTLHSKFASECKKTKNKKMNASEIEIVVQTNKGINGDQTTIRVGTATKCDVTIDWGDGNKTILYGICKKKRLNHYYGVSAKTEKIYNIRIYTKDGLITFLDTNYGIMATVVSLNLNKCRSLQDLRVAGLKELDLTNNSELISLGCFHGQLQRINLENNAMLEFLYIYSHNIKSLNLNQCNRLNTLYIHDCTKLHNIDLGNNSVLYKFEYDDNTPLYKHCLSSIIKILEMNFSEIKLTVQMLECSESKHSFIKVGAEKACEVSIDWGDGYNAIVYLDADEAKQIEHSYKAEPKMIYTIRIFSEGGLITYFDCDSFEQKVLSLDVSMCASLKYLKVDEQAKLNLGKQKKCL